MPKYLTPVSRAKIRELHMEVASLQEKLAKQALQHEKEVIILRDQLAGKDVEIEQFKSPSGKELKETSKSHLQPTKATQRKQVPKKKPSSPSPPTAIRDPQGKLVVDSSLNEAGYMQPTKASLRREGCLGRLHASSDSSLNEWGTGLSQCSTHLAPDQSWDTYGEPDRQTPIVTEEHGGQVNVDYEPTEYYSYYDGDRGNCRHTCHCQFCEDFRCGRHVRVVEEMQDRTRCHDNFFQKPSSHVHIPFTHQLRLLRGAHSIAQHAYYHGLEKHWPGKEMFHYPLGPESVRFGTGELKEIFGDMNVFGARLRELLYPELKLLYPSWDDLCTHMPTFVRPTISGMVGLRNVLAHPSNLTSEFVDALLKSAQDLACMMRDESRALEVRALRDELRKLVEQSFEELVRLEPLLPLPNDILWSVHHEATFQETLRCLRHVNASPMSALECEYERYYDPAVVRAARHWAEQYTIPGLGSWLIKSHQLLSYKHNEHLSNWMRDQRRLQKEWSRKVSWKPRIELDIEVQKLCERPLLM